MQTFLTYVTCGLVGIILILVVTIIVAIIKKSSKSTTLSPSTPSPRNTPPPLPRRGWISSWTTYFKTLVILTTLGVVGAIVFVPGVWKGVCLIFDYAVKNPGAGIGLPLVIVAWFSYNFLRELPPKHVINARFAMVTGLICIGIWIWPLLGENKVQRLGDWWKTSMVPIRQIPPQPARPTQHIFVTNENQAVHPAGQDTRTITVRVSSVSWTRVDWPEDYYYQVFGSPRPVQVFFCRQLRMPNEDQQPDGVMKITGEDNIGILASLDPLWLKAESNDPNTEVVFDLLIGFSHR